MYQGISFLKDCNRVDSSKLINVLKDYVLGIYFLFGTIVIDNAGNTWKWNYDIVVVLHSLCYYF